MDFWRRSGPWSFLGPLLASNGLGPAFQWPRSGRARPPPSLSLCRAAAALFRRHQTAGDELRDAEIRLRERHTVDRAKAILIRERRIAKPDAYRWLRERAMASGRRIPDIAREVVNERAQASAQGDTRVPSKKNAQP